MSIIIIHVQYYNNYASDLSLAVGTINVTISAWMLGLGTTRCPTRHGTTATRTMPRESGVLTTPISTYTLPLRGFTRTLHMQLTMFTCLVNLLDMRNVSNKASEKKNILLFPVVTFVSIRPHSRITSCQHV